MYVFVLKPKGSVQHMPRILLSSPSYRDTVERILNWASEDTYQQTQETRRKLTKCDQSIKTPTPGTPSFKGEVNQSWQPPRSGFALKLTGCDRGRDIGEYMSWMDFPFFRELPLPRLASIMVQPCRKVGEWEDASDGNSSRLVVQ